MTASMIGWFFESVGIATCLCALIVLIVVLFAWLEVIESKMPDEWLDAQRERHELIAEVTRLRKGQ